ncbi:MAG: hypothetical protein O3C67_11955, partial [Cyanobacteria bacterium]|nr:hypothetical protein [Cyanobacteriota bacterium]
MTVFKNRRTMGRLYRWSGLGAIAIALPLTVATVGSHLSAHADTGHGDHGDTHTPAPHPAPHGDSDGHGDSHGDSHGHGTLEI